MSSKDKRGGRRGGSGGDAGGGGGAPRDNTSFSTAESVNKINELASQDGTRTEIKGILDGVREGQKVTTYNQFRNGYFQASGAIENEVTWTKREDGNWSGSNGDVITSSDMVRTIYSGGRKIEAGEITTESRTQVTGREGREYNGLRYAKGQYDVMARGNGGTVKRSTEGQITSYNGTQYGVTKEGKGKNAYYKVTHVPTGMSTGTDRNLKTLNDVSDHIKRMDGIIKGMDSIGKAEEQFRKTRRGD